VSRYDESCTDPRPSSTGPKVRNVARTPSSRTSSEGRIPRSNLATSGTCTSSCSPDPITAPQASQIATSKPSPPANRRPATIAVAINATFHRTGAA